MSLQHLDIKAEKLPEVLIVDDTIFNVEIIKMILE